MRSQPTNARCFSFALADGSLALSSKTKCQIWKDQVSNSLLEFRWSLTILRSVYRFTIHKLLMSVRQRLKGSLSPSAGSRSPKGVWKFTTVDHCHVSLIAMQFPEYYILSNMWRNIGNNENPTTLHQTGKINHKRKYRKSRHHLSSHLAKFLV